MSSSILTMFSLYSASCVTRYTSKAGRRRRRFVFRRVERFRLRMAPGPRRVPLEFTFVVEPGPQILGQAPADEINVGYCQVRFEYRGPHRALDLAKLLAILACIDECLANRLVAFDDKLGQAPLCRLFLFGSKRFATCKMAFVEIDDPAEADLIRRAVIAVSNGCLSTV